MRPATGTAISAARRWPARRPSDSAARATRTPGPRRPEPARPRRRGPRTGRDRPSSGADQNGDVAGPRLQRVLDPQALDFDLHAAEQAAHDAPPVLLQSPPVGPGGRRAAPQVAHDELSRRIARSRRGRRRWSRTGRSRSPGPGPRGWEARRLLRTTTPWFQTRTAITAPPRCVEPSARSVKVPERRAHSLHVHADERGHAGMGHGSGHEVVVEEPGMLDKKQETHAVVFHTCAPAATRSETHSGADRVPPRGPALRPPDARAHDSGGGNRNRSGRPACGKISPRRLMAPTGPRSSMEGVNCRSQPKRAFVNPCCSWTSTSSETLEHFGGPRLRPSDRGRLVPRRRVGRRRPPRPCSLPGRRAGA